MRVPDVNLLLCSRALFLFVPSSSFFRGLSVKGEISGNENCPAFNEGCRTEDLSPSAEITGPGRATVFAGGVPSPWSFTYESADFRAVIPKEGARIDARPVTDLITKNQRNEIIGPAPCPESRLSEFGRSWDSTLPMRHSVTRSHGMVQLPLSWQLSARPTGACAHRDLDGIHSKQTHPRRIKGNTLTARSADMVLPHAATRPPYFADLRAVARMLPPTVSTAPAQRPF